MIYRAVQEPDRDGGEEVELDLCKRSSQSLILCSTGFLSRISRIGHLSKFLFCSIRRAGGKDAWQFLTSDGIYVHFHCQLISRRVASLAPYFSSQLATPLFHTYRHSTSYIYPFFFSFRTTGSLHMVKVAKAGCNGMNVTACVPSTSMRPVGTVAQRHTASLPCPNAFACKPLSH